MPHASDELPDGRPCLPAQVWELWVCFLVFQTLKVQLRQEMETKRNVSGCNSSVLHLASLDAYPISEIVYTWKKGPLSSVEVPQESSSLLQYDLIGQTVSSERLKSNTGDWRSLYQKLFENQDCYECQFNRFCVILEGVRSVCYSARAQVNMSSWLSTSTCRGKWASSLSRLTFRVSWQSFWLRSLSGLTRNLFQLGPSSVSFVSVGFECCN